jgi:iron(III) transport system ATP-binding protein
MPDITVAGLSKAFGQGLALSDISFSVRDKEFLTLLGPSGCGKTTTLMSIAGFQRPDQGTISCGDRIFFDRAGKVDLAAEDRNLGMVFQSYAIWPHLTVFGNVAFPLKIRRMKRDAVRRRVLDVLELVELAGYAGRYPHELSGGQQQRVALARALVYSPAVLLLDEPFSSLDAKLRERARAWLKHLQGELGLTTLFVTHDQDEALSLSDRIVVMNAG